MRHLHRTLAFFGILATGAFVQLAGCSDDANNCEANYEPCTTSSGSSSSGNVVPEGCEKSPAEDAAVIRDECGIFVSASAADGGDGSKAKPFKRLQDGLNAAKSKIYRVYACAEEYAEAATMESVSLFGGFDCAAGWTYVSDGSKRATIVPADGVPLRVTGAGALSVQDIIATAPDYAAIDPVSGEPAKSSIATIVDGANVTFSRCALEARGGQNGADGVTLDPDPTLDGANGLPGIDACKGDLFNGAPGGAASMHTCDGQTTEGGKGGDGGLIQQSPQMALPGGDGDNGGPGGTGGAKGLGEFETAMVVTLCTDGQKGANGLAGDAGAGATMTGTLKDGAFEPANGAAGQGGQAGKGGGGGGGARGGTNICTGMIKSGTGATGGSGGAGGCGGKGGGGGGGGAASIGLLSIQASVSVVDCEIKAGAGGNGGAGGAGQAGGTGGVRGGGGKGTSASENACFGGDGGKGGKGGPGGGGAGGPSVGVAHNGKAPATSGTTSITKGAGGKGGPGGDGNVSMNAGSDGPAEDSLELN